MVFPIGDPEVTSYLIILAEKLSLTPIKHSFPIVGKVPYLGFFEKTQRELYLESITQDYDIHFSEAGAFSLLGYIKDPIFPSMLRGDYQSIASLFFHELTHATVWIKDSTEFNEALAEYVSEILTIEYLKENQLTEQLDNFKTKISDQQLYFVWLDQLKQDLNQVYQNTKLSDQIKLDNKHQIITDAVNNKPDFVEYDFVGNVEGWNNAKIALTSTYKFNKAQFDQALNCSVLQSLDQKLKTVFKLLNKHKSAIKGLSSETILNKLCSYIKKDFSKKATTG